MLVILRHPLLSHPAWLWFTRACQISHHPEHGVLAQSFEQPVICTVSSLRFTAETATIASPDLHRKLSWAGAFHSGPSTCRAETAVSEQRQLPLPGDLCYVPSPMWHTAANRIWGREPGIRSGHSPIASSTPWAWTQARGTASSHHHQGQAHRATLTASVLQTHWAGPVVWPAVTRLQWAVAAVGSKAVRACATETSLTTVRPRRPSWRRMPG